MSLTLFFALPVAAFQNVDVNDACGDGATEGEDCGMEDGHPTTEGTCQPAGGDLLVCTAAAATTPEATTPADDSDQIIPTFSIPIPTVSLSPIREYEADEIVNTETGTTSVRVTYIDIPWMVDYVEGAYRYAVFVGAILAVVMLMLGGLQWMTSGGDASRVTAAKKRINNAVVGLVLVIGSYTLLATISEDFILLQPTKIRSVIPDQYEWVGTPDEDAPTPSGGTYTASGSSSNSSNAAHRDSMFSICREGGTLDDLKAVLPVWVDSGRRGAAVYVRGGRTGTRNCTWNVRRGQAGIDWLTNHLTGRGISFPSNPTLAQLTPIYEQQVLGPIFADGRACGDCVSWTQQLHRCAGRQWPTVNDIKFAGSPYKIADAATCREAIASIPGGLQFGDAFYTNNVGHQFTYTGGEGLPYEIVEMGGWVTCRTRVAGLGGTPMACISTHGLDEYLTWVDRPRGRGAATGTTGGRSSGGNCMIFRLYPVR